MLAFNRKQSTGLGSFQSKHLEHIWLSFRTTKTHDHFLPKIPVIKKWIRKIHEYKFRDWWKRTYLSRSEMRFERRGTPAAAAALYSCYGVMGVTENPNRGWGGAMGFEEKEAEMRGATMKEWFGINSEFAIQLFLSESLLECLSGVSKKSWAWMNPPLGIWKW